MSRYGGTCLACGSLATWQTGRVLACSDCEITYYVPARELVAQMKADAATAGRTTIRERVRRRFLRDEAGEALA